MAKPKSKSKAARAKVDPLIDRERLLAEFDMITEQDLATLLRVDVKTLRNRSRSELPTFSKVGRERLFHKEAVKTYLAATVPGPSQRLRVDKPRPKRADDRPAP